ARREGPYRGAQLSGGDLPAARTRGRTRLAESVQQAMNLSGHAPQLRIACRIDPVGALRGRGEKNVLLAAKRAPQLGARKQRGEPRRVAGRHEAEPVERAGDHAVVHKRFSRIAKRTRDLEAQILV